MNFNVYGPGRCGSYLMSLLLNAHPKVSILPSVASDFFFYRGGKGLGIPNSGGVAESVDAFAAGATERGHQLAADSSEGRGVVMIRDPRDVVASWRRFARQPENAIYRAVIEQIPPRAWGAFWAACSNTKRRPDAFHYVHYVDVVLHPRETTIGALRHFNLNADGIEWPHSTNLEEMRRRHGTTRNPEDSIGTWPSELSPTEARAVIAAAGEGAWYWNFV